MTRLRVSQVVVMATMGAIGVAAGALAAHEPTESTVVEGEIVNPSSYVMEGLRGPRLVEETATAVKAGQTLAILEDTTGTLYLLLALPGKDPNRLVHDYLHQHVRLTGYPYQRGGLQGIVAETVEPLEPVEPD